MTAQHVTWAEAERIGERLSQRDWAVLRSLAAVRVLTGDQLTRLHFQDLSSRTRERVRRRVLARLTELQIVARLGRAVGGVRAGSSGWVYALDVAGQRLAQLDRGQRDDTGRLRRAWTPSVLFLGHSLAVAELYVRLVEQARGAAFTVAAFQAEPACWWPDGLGGFIKPDAFVALSTERFDELVWLEVDRGTESLPTLRRKLHGYLDFVERGQLGPRDAVPQVVVAVPDEHRYSGVQGLVQRFAGDIDGLFTVVTFSKTADYLTGLTLSQSNRPP